MSKERRKGKQQKVTTTNDPFDLPFATIRGALGISHGLGHLLGATYKIGHGITSCLTLSKS